MKTKESIRKRVKKKKENPNDERYTNSSMINQTKTLEGVQASSGKLPLQFETPMLPI